VQIAWPTKLKIGAKSKKGENMFSVFELVLFCLYSQPLHNCQSYIYNEYHMRVYENRTNSDIVQMYRLLHYTHWSSTVL